MPPQAPCSPDPELIDPRPAVGIKSEVTGLAGEHRFLVPAAAAANFEGYFSPDHPDPPLTQATQRTASV